MSLLASLSNAKSGMSATNVRARTTSANIANVSTPGYVRRETVLSQSSQTGVLVSGIARIQDQLMVQSRRDAQSQSAGSEVINTTMARALAAYGEPGSTTGMFGTLAQFESDLQTLRSTPESEAAAVIAIDSLKSMTQALTQASYDLQVERTQADAQIAVDINLVNTLAQNVYELNGHIRKAGAAGGDTAPLLDQRDTLLDQIAERLPVRIDYEESGAVSVRTDTGLSLVGPTVNLIEFEPSNRIGSADVTTVDGGRLSIPTLQGQPIGPGSGAHGISEGRIAANLKIRDTQMPGQAAALDDFAYDLADAFAAIGESLLLDNGNPIDPLNKAGISERLSVNPLVDPARGGDPTRLRDGLAAVVPGAPGNDTLLTQIADALAPFSDRLGTVISDVSSAAYRATLVHTGNVAREITLSDSENQFSGVDLDHELQSLLAIEQAYTANAKVIQTISDMYDTLARI